MVDGIIKSDKKEKEDICVGEAMIATGHKKWGWYLVPKEPVSSNFFISFQILHVLLTPTHYTQHMGSG